ncbi:MAG: hypothetical protein ABH858_04390, partial [Candidatus Omnitrophota bacterium]
MERLFTHQDLARTEFPGFKKFYPVYIGLPSDIELQTRSLQFISQAEPFGNLCVSGDSILLHPAKISHIVVDVEGKNFSKRRLIKAINESGFVAKHSIPVISLSEAVIECQLIRRAREQFDRVNLLKEGDLGVLKMEFKEVTADIRGYNSLKNGDIVVIKAPLSRPYLGYIIEAQGVKSVRSLDTDKSEHGFLVGARMAERRIVIPNGRHPWSVRYGYHPVLVSLEFLKKGGNISLEEIEESGFLEAAAWKYKDASSSAVWQSFMKVETDNIPHMNYIISIITEAYRMASADYEKYKDVLARLSVELCPMSGMVSVTLFQENSKADVIVSYIKSLKAIHILKNMYWDRAGNIVHITEEKERIFFSHQEPYIKIVQLKDVKSPSSSAAKPKSNPGGLIRRIRAVAAIVLITIGFNFVFSAAFIPESAQAKIIVDERMGKYKLLLETSIDAAKTFLTWPIESDDKEVRLMAERARELLNGEDIEFIFVIGDMKKILDNNPEHLKDYDPTYVDNDQQRGLITPLGSNRYLLTLALRMFKKRGIGAIVVFLTHEVLGHMSISDDEKKDMPVLEEEKIVFRREIKYLEALLGNKGLMREMSLAENVVQDIRALLEQDKVYLAWIEEKLKVPAEAPLTNRWEEYLVYIGIVLAAMAGGFCVVKTGIFTVIYRKIRGSAVVAEPATKRKGVRKAGKKRPRKSGKKTSSPIETTLADAVNAHNHIEVVVFDNDGVLWEGEHLYFPAYIEIYARIKRGVPFGLCHVTETDRRAWLEYEENITGLTALEIIEDLLENAGQKGSIALIRRYFNLFEAVYRRNLLMELKIKDIMDLTVPGSVETVKAVAALNKYRLYVNSGSTIGILEE